MNIENINAKKHTDLIKIMVVDDSDLSRRTIVSLLEQNGFNVVGEASNAENAITQAFNTKANLFLIDIVMPNVSGLELANLLKDKIKDSRIIMMSTLDMEGVVLESISNGAVDYLSKPFTEEDLIRSVGKVESDLLKELGM